MPIDGLVTNLREPALREIVRLWDEARGGRRFPAWRDIDPVKLAPHLPILWAWRWDETRGTFIGRLAGEAILDAMGPGFRGSRIEDYFAGRNAETFMARYRRILDEPAAMVNSGFVFSLIGGSGIGERVALPLADDGEHPDGVFGATIYRVTGERLARYRVTVASGRETVRFFPL
ncbi:PAS domain-containing protein [Phenylobacterium sp.]|uniref:PAS domain-containing protein n=1 Tax=Phenylobacterium sp. TaxID=1871053 RepID=UPI002CC1BB8F|nr:PAS domain-containing protein [Phenylobacterium sp.]HLZ74802.1 PAS domain-containing protein [Phenylobacterium sp.]